MPFAVELYFDTETETAVRRTWEEIAQAGIRLSMSARGYRPHVSLGVCDGLDVDGLSSGLSRYAETLLPFTFTLSSIGIFPTEEGVMFFGVTVTQELLKVHEAFYPIFERFAKEKREYYRVGSWVPHCTLADGLSDRQMAEAAIICQNTSLPIHGQVEEIGIVEVSPVSCYPLFLLGLGSLAEDG